MDRGFAAICQLARTLPASHPVFVHRLASLLHASFRPHLAVRPLRFAITSPPSGCEEDLHLPVVGHARHTKKKGRAKARPYSKATKSIAANPQSTRSKRGKIPIRKIEKRENSCYFAAFALTPLKASVRRDL